MKTIGPLTLLTVLCFGIGTFFLLPNNIEQSLSTPTQPIIQEQVEPEDTLSLEEKVGQLFMIGHFSHMPVASTTERIETYNIGSVVLMDAPENPTTIESWTEEWQAVSAIPLLIAIDQEGGVVSRLKSEEFITTAQSELSSPDDANRTASQRAKALLHLGINTNLSPVLDTSTKPSAFMHNRTFANTNTTAVFGDAMVRGYQSSGMLAIPKHYPGHPDTSDDSHITLPKLEMNAVEYQAHTAQFADIIANGNVYAIMTAHVSVPVLDSEKPATLSAAVLSDLRNRLHYDGVVITDDLAMKPISDRWSYGEASVLALLAGADIILVAAEPEKINDSVTAVLQAVQTGVLDETRITEAYTRVQKAKRIIN